jgi:hypothetical protein
MKETSVNNGYGLEPISMNVICMQVLCNTVKELINILFYKPHFHSSKMNVKRKTNKVDRAKRKHCVRSERAVAITLVARRL